MAQTTILLKLEIYEETGNWKFMSIRVNNWKQFWWLSLVTIHWWSSSPLPPPEKWVICSIWLFPLCCAVIPCSLLVGVCGVAPVILIPSSYCIIVSLTCVVNYSYLGKSMCYQHVMCTVHHHTTPHQPTHSYLSYLHHVTKYMDWDSAVRTSLLIRRFVY